MKQANIFVGPVLAAVLIEHSRVDYELVYESGYTGPDVSLSLPKERAPFRFTGFPAFFEGLLPEGVQLQALLRQKKLDEGDYFSQLIAVGEDLVGAVTVKERK